MADNCYNLPLIARLEFSGDRVCLFEPSTGQVITDPADRYEFDELVDFPCNLVEMRHPDSSLTSSEARGGLDTYRHAENPRAQRYRGSRDIEYENVTLQLQRNDVNNDDTITDFVEFYEDTIQKIQPFAWPDAISGSVKVAKIVGGNLEGMSFTDRQARNLDVSFTLELRDLTEEDLS